MQKATLFLLPFIAAGVLVAADGHQGQTEASKGDCCAWMKDAKFEVVNTDNGVKLTVTAAHAETVKAVQEHFAGMAKEGCGRHGGKAGCTLDDKAGCGKKDGCKHHEKAGAKAGCPKPCCKDQKAEAPPKCPHAEGQAAAQLKR
jgi:hypothetical protein